MPPSLDHALIGHGLIGDTARGHRACRQERRGLHAAGECTGQKGRRTEKNELTHVFSSGRRIFPQSQKRAAFAFVPGQGATVHELNAIFGWTGTKMALRYTEAMDRKRLAAAGMARLAVHSGKTAAN
jgi:hypothetical protein